jgi:hypothetical protein
MKKTFTFLALAACLAISTKGTSQVIYSENFEGATVPALPTGWGQNVTPSDSVGWHTGDSASASSTSFKINAHSHFAYINDDAHQYAANGDILMKTGNFSLASATTPFLSFDLFYFAGSYGGFSEVSTVEVSFDTGATWTVLSTLTANSVSPWQTRYVDLSSAVGHSSVMLGFRYKDNTGWLFGIAVDNISVFTPPSSDLGLTSVAPATGTPPSYGVGGSNINLTGTIFNYGGTTVTSYNLNYVFNGGSVVTSTVSASIAPFTSATFSAATPVTLPATNGTYPVRVWVSLAGDANHTNDSSATQSLTAVSFMPVKKLAMEEGTGTWCGWCVRGIVFMDSLRTLYGSNVSLVAVHNADPMTVTAYDSWMGGQIGGYPSVVVDRSYVIDPSDLLNIYNAHHMDFGFADITATATVTASTVTVSASVKPALDLSGNYRLALVLTEDGVHGIGSTWDQHNYYSGSTTLPLSGGGVNYNAVANPIPGANMFYQHVARSITPGVTGTTASALPTSMTAGTLYPLTLTATVAAGWNLNYMHGIVLLLDNATGKVMNSQSVVLSLGVNNVASDIQNVSIYPNPTVGAAYINFNLDNASKVTVNISDATGRIVRTIPATGYAAGNQKIEISTEGFTAGIYNVNVSTNAGSFTEKLTVAK